jgi:hypothetical protein
MANAPAWRVGPALKVRASGDARIIADFPTEREVSCWIAA